MIINWKPNRSISISLHIQIVEYFKKKIKEGHWVCGEKFPSQRKLAELLEVNRSTIVVVMDELKAQGLITTNGKGGTVISIINWPNMTENKNNMLNHLMSSGILKRKNEIYNKIEEKKNVLKVNFGIGELDQSLYPVETMKSMMYSAISEIDQLPYGNQYGYEDLIDRIKEKMRSLDIDMDENEILIVSGATQGLFLIVLGLLSKDVLIKTDIPCYIKSLEIFKAAGLMIEDILRNKESIFNVFYMIPTFHNPTGKLMSKNDREVFMNQYGRRNPVIEDDVFRDLWYDEEPPLPLKAMIGGENVIYINSFSKALAPGLRIGWVCASKNIIDKLREIKNQMDSGTSIINQKIVLKWLNSSEYTKHTQYVRNRLRKRRDLIEEILSKDFRDFFSWTKPSGGYYYWLKSKKQIKALSIFEKSLEYGLVVLPGELYGEEDSFNIRISFAGCEEEKIKEGFKILREVISDLFYGL